MRILQLQKQIQSVDNTLIYQKAKLSRETQNILAYLHRPFTWITLFAISYFGYRYMPRLPRTPLLLLKKIVWHNR